MAVLQSSFTYLLDGTEIYCCVLHMSGYNGCVKLLKPSGHYMYRTVVTICTAQWSLYVPYSGHYMYRSGHYMYRTVVTICTVQWSLYVPYSGHYMYRHFNIQQFYVLPTQCIYVFCVDLRTNRDYFPIQH